MFYTKKENLIVVRTVVFVKGISSMMAAILLVIAVIVVATIVGTYLPQLPKTSATVVGQNNAQVICGTGAISLTDIHFCNNAISGYVANTGNIPLGDITLTLSYTNITFERIYLSQSGSALNASSTCCSDLAMLPNDKFFFTFPVGGSNYDTLSVSTNCTNPEVSAQAAASQGQISATC